MTTCVVPALGVKEKERLLELFVQLLPPFVEYATAVFGLGHAVSVIVQVTDHA